jgi:hypothetical protein
MDRILRSCTGLCLGTVSDVLSFECGSWVSSLGYLYFVKLIHRLERSLGSARAGDRLKARNAQLLRARPVRFTY